MIISSHNKSLWLHFFKHNYILRDIIKNMVLYVTDNGDLYGKDKKI